MLKLPVSQSLAHKLFNGEQNLVITNKEYDDAGDTITLIDRDTQKPLGFATLDSCKCDISKNIFKQLHLIIRNFTIDKFYQITQHHQLVFVLKLSQIQKFQA